MSLIAHEFGYVVQTDHGYQNEINYGIPNNVELNGDFLAGYYLGIRKLSIPSLQFEKGEDFFSRIGTSAPVRLHGNPEERVSAVRAGFRVGYIDRASIADAVRAGFEYIGYRPERI